MICSSATRAPLEGAVFGTSRVGTFGVLIVGVIARIMGRILIGTRSGCRGDSILLPSILAAIIAISCFVSGAILGLALFKGEFHQKLIAVNVFNLL
jgi:hypothetical protein